MKSDSSPHEMWRVTSLHIKWKEWLLMWKVTPLHI
jgi:hypothetical protein